MRSCDSSTVGRLYRFFFDDTILTASTVREPLINTESPDSVLPLAVRDEWAKCVYCGGPKTDDDINNNRRRTRGCPQPAPLFSYV